MGPHPVSLVERMLDRDRKKRLGMQKGGANSIKEHPYFGNVDFKATYAKAADPPWRPPIKSLDDMFNLDDYDEELDVPEYFGDSHVFDEFTTDAEYCDDAFLLAGGDQGWAHPDIVQN